MCANKKDMNSNYYLKFENKFRGDREKIINIFKAYEPLIDLDIQQDPSANLSYILLTNFSFVELLFSFTHNSNLLEILSGNKV